MSATDDWNTTVERATNYVVTATDWTEVQRNLQALFNGIVGDAQATSEVIHRHLTGTLAARPAAGNAGRFYTATDINCIFWDDGSDWRILSVQAYDSLYRANENPISAMDGGHSWTEESGDWEIASDAAQLNTGSATPGIITADLGGTLDAVTLDFQVNIRTGATASTSTIGIITRWVDSNNYLYWHLYGPGTAIRIVSVVGGTPDTSTSMSFTPANSTSYVVRIRQAGPVVDSMLTATQTTSAPQALTLACRDPDLTLPAGLQGATEVGLRLGTVEHDQIGYFSVAGHG